MENLIARWMQRLEEDPWRRTIDFSPELNTALHKALDPLLSDDDVIRVLNDWIMKHQPCLFGRLAAKNNGITYCLIREDVLNAGDVEIEKSIQDARQKWTRAGFDGRSSNFIIAVLSKRLAFAKPDKTLLKIALRLCSLYLQQKVEADHIYLDRLYLEQPGHDRTTWEWVAGVNYFAANGDGRWWHDHRFPAGIAFSVNSVGHMVKAGKLLRGFRELQELMGTASGTFKDSKIDSLEKALEFAMRTIDMPSNAASGKPISLLPLKSARNAKPKCPAGLDLPPFLADKDYRRYKGFYHTDVTIPSAYFNSRIKRPRALVPHTLDFTYLFDPALDNPDFDRMGEGRMIRAADSKKDLSQQDYRYLKRLRGAEVEARIDDIPRLKEALAK